MWAIEEELPCYTFLVRNEYTGMRYEVIVAEEHRVLFDDKSVFTSLPKACPFFRKGKDTDLWYCTVHLTRPDVCREFACWRFLILDQQGRRAGRVMGTRHLHAEDLELQKIWDEKVRVLIEPDDAAWDEKMCEIIRSAGFIIRD
ncbi:MAG: YkgJ family cysteine cluster protein [Methanomicrobiales archaeon]|jgi:Fe-S-cluster containining protein|nr:YkgJ family cysteine cluster protein [Methanomicrobiales archaeon]